MKSSLSLVCVLILHSYIYLPCDGFKILAIFPSNGHSHHIIFSSFVEELAARNHEVTVINYFPVKKSPNLRQISLQYEIESVYNNIDMEDNLKTIPNSFLIDFYRAYDMALAFKYMSDDNCERLMSNSNVRELIAAGEKYDVVIAEQFITDCSLAIAYKVNAPAIGMTAHIMMPWTYSRLGAPNNPVFVPNHMFASGTYPSTWQKVKSALINMGMSAYFRHVIQKSNHETINKVFPEVPDLEILAKNMSLVMLNQYFPLTGSRLYGANVVEVGGLHIKDDKTIDDKELQDFLAEAENGVVYISFGTVARDFPREVMHEIMTFVKNTKMRFIWKVDKLVHNDVPKNLLMRTWVPQSSVLCHPNVVAFVTHSGMLSTSEAVHCGVPIIAVPLFGDQFSNAQAALENGMGVVLDIYSINSNILEDSLRTVLQDTYQERAKQFSKIWKDRPLSAMDTAVYWTEYVARHQGTVNMRPPTVNLNTFEYFMVDVYIFSTIFVMAVIYTVFNSFRFFFNLCKPKPAVKKRKTRKHE